MSDLDKLGAALFRLSHHLRRLDVLQDKDAAKTYEQVVAAFTVLEDKPEQQPEKPSPTSTIKFVQEWMMSTDHKPTNWDFAFAAAIDNRARRASTVMRERCVAVVQSFEKYEAADFPVCSSIVDGIRSLELKFEKDNK